ncbi:MAG: protein phosphatase 2C domain-containing protein [Bacillota bacterium]|nr:protein phosphatase 2C domain-containing protein [Bacillota bacterium]
MAKINPGNAQHIGRRSEQQDSFGFSDIFDKEVLGSTGGLAVLCDGMGGMSMGKEASIFSVRKFLEIYPEYADEKNKETALINTIKEVNRSFVSYAEVNNILGNVGTTLAVSLIFQGYLFYASVGDSRIYFYRDNNLIRLTEDHIYEKKLQEKVNLGLISLEEALSHPQKNALTSYIGINNLDEIFISKEPVKLKSRDKILLCSDGLYNYLDEEDIKASLKQEAQEAADMLIAKTMDRGNENQDNITAVIMEYLENDISDKKGIFRIFKG